MDAADHPESTPDSADFIVEPEGGPMWGQTCPQRLVGSQGDGSNATPASWPRRASSHNRQPALEARSAPCTPSDAQAA